MRCWSIRIKLHFIISATAVLIDAGKVTITVLLNERIQSVVLGFAAQKTFFNIISGIFIAIFKPFRVSDLIKFRDKVGRVEDINLRHTTLRNFENKRYIAPNSVISDDVIENYHISDPKVCRFVDFSISYDSNIDKAMKIMSDKCEKHPEFIDTRSDIDKDNKVPKVFVRVIGFGESSVNLKAWAWAKDPLAAFRLGTDLNKAIKQRFDSEGIEIPYPYRSVVYKTDIEKAVRHRRKR